MLLGEQGDEVHPAVAVQIGGNELDAAGARVDRVGDERRLRRVAGAILEHGDLPGLAPPERGDREIRLAIPVEVRRIDAGDTRPAVEPERAVFALRQATHPDHGALGVIGREELPHLRDEEILHAVLVDVGERDVSRMGNARDLRESPARRTWIAAEDEPLAHVGAEDVELTVAVQVDEAHVGHRRSAGHSGDGHRPARERQRRPAGLRPGFR